MRVNARITARFHRRPAGGRPPGCSVVDGDRMRLLFHPCPAAPISGWGPGPPGLIASLRAADRGRGAPVGQAVGVGIEDAGAAGDAGSGEWSSEAPRARLERVVEALVVLRLVHATP